MLRKKKEDAIKARKDGLKEEDVSVKTIPNENGKWKLAEVKVSSGDTTTFLSDPMYHYRVFTDDRSINVYTSLADGNTIWCLAFTELENVPDYVKTFVIDHHGKIFKPMEKGILLAK